MTTSEAHLLGTNSIKLPDPYLEHLLENQRQLDLWYEQEMERISKMSPAMIRMELEDRWRNK